MALISISFAISILTYNLLQKLQIYDRLTTWMIFKNLLFCLPPTKDQLRVASGVTRTKQEGNRRHRGRQPNQLDTDKLLIPKTIEIDLVKHELDPQVISGIRYYVELKWLLNVCATSVIAYVFTEIYYCIKDLVTGAEFNTARQTETNFSLLWCIVTIFLCALILARFIHLYFGVVEHGEFFTVMLAGMAGAIISMGILTFDDRTFEFGLKDAHNNFTEKLMKIPAINEFAKTINFSFFGFGLLVGTLSGVTTALIAFPGIRFGKMYRDARDLAVFEGRKNDVIFFAINFGLPTVDCLLWLPAIREHFWVENPYISYNSARILAILVSVLIRFAFLHGFLQAHLDLPRKKLMALRQEPGRIDSEELQNLLANPSRYTCVVAVQYVAPHIVLIMLCFLYMSADLESFFPVRGSWTYNKLFEWLGLPRDYTTTVLSIHNAVWSLFTGALLKTFFGYLIWWILMSHFVFALFAFYVLHDN